MRLFIAGILTLVIYLLTCAYGNEGKKVPEVYDTPSSVYYLKTLPDFRDNYLPLYSPKDYPVTTPSNKDTYSIQTFSNV